MAIVGTCKNGTPNQLPAWTSYRFAVFLERDPAGLPPYLNGAREKAALKTPPRGNNGGPAEAETRDDGSKKMQHFVARNPRAAANFLMALQDATSLVESCKRQPGKEVLL